MKAKTNKFALPGKQYDLEIMCLLVIGPLLLGVINVLSLLFFGYNLFN
jgi:hypothetical protein